MSKKVVHLADDAHELAKAYCKDSGMKMSDWVAMLIKRAVEPGKSAPVAAAPAASQFAAPAPHYEQSYAPRAEQSYAQRSEPRFEPQRTESYGRIPDTTPARVVTSSATASSLQSSFSQRAVTTTVAPAERANQTVKIGDAERGVIPKKKPMTRELSSENEDSVPVYAQPPFWARAK